MPTSQLIICEKTGKWAAALRRQLAKPTADRLFETRLIEDCEQQLVAKPCSIAAIEQTWNNYDSVLALLSRITRGVPLARAIILDETRDTGLSRLDQLSGAIHVTSSRLRLRHAARLVMRHLAKFPARSSLREDLIGWLPWGD